MYFFGKFILICFLSMRAVGEGRHYYVPPTGFVPDGETAIKIAEAVLIPIYGDKKINSERPFKVTLINNIWIIEGSMRKGLKGGVALIEIAKEDAKIIRVTHGK